MWDDCYVCRGVVVFLSVKTIVSVSPTPPTKCTCFFCWRELHYRPSSLAMPPVHKPTARKLATPRVESPREWPRVLGDVTPFEKDPDGVEPVKMQDFSTKHGREAVWSMTYDWAQLSPSSICQVRTSTAVIDSMAQDVKKPGAGGDPEKFLWNSDEIPVQIWKSVLKNRKPTNN